jgi:hypothetical protein
MTRPFSLDHGRSEGFVRIRVAEEGGEEARTQKSVENIAGPSAPRAGLCTDSGGWPPVCEEHSKSGEEQVKTREDAGMMR